MIEIEFDSVEDATEAVRELHYLGRAKIEKKIHHDVSKHYYLNSAYEKALDELKNAEKIFETNKEYRNNVYVEENPADYLYIALTVLKKLFESGKFKELVNKNPSEAEDRLFEIDAEMDLNEKFRDIKVLKEETNEIFQKVLDSEIFQKPDDENDTKESDLPISNKPDEHGPDDSFQGDSDDPNDIVNSKYPGDNFAKLLDFNWKRQFLITPIIESVNFHSDSEDPYARFMYGVYLNVTHAEDLFFGADFRLKFASNIYVTYNLNLGLEFILQKNDLIDSLSELPVVNEDVIEEIQMVSVIADGILSTLEKHRKVKYRKFIFDATELFNDKIFNYDELDVEFSLDSDFVELIIKDLARIGLIKTKGKKIIRYTMD
ncbi:MAG: hypothetical protein A4E26_00670 [Methanobacterium sp. PtaU1.Bin097]|jgi:hypothetical protein|nr:hypothetical protein [Methanobacteriaceae archaeon]OPY23792.1 MAG: hypothetical protein A4E26_00670 [Methanobacterium sp. PtaU1.Bin097]